MLIRQNKIDDEWGTRGVTYEITSLGISSEILTERFTNDNVPLCEQLSGF